MKRSSVRNWTRCCRVRRCTSRMRRKRRMRRTAPANRIRGPTAICWPTTARRRATAVVPGRGSATRTARGPCVGSEPACTTVESPRPPKRCCKEREREREKSRFFLALRWHPPFAPLCSRTSRTTTSCLSLRNPRYTLSLLNHARHHHHHWKIPSNQRESERTFFFASYPHDRSALIQSPLRVVNNNKKKESTITRFGTRTTMQLAGPTMSSKPISGSRMLIMSFLSFVSQTEKIYEKLIEDRNSI